MRCAGECGKGDIVEVNDGYARNFLIRRGLAKEATASVINETNQRRAADEKRRKEELEAAKQAASKLEGTTVEIAIRCGENGKPFGAVTGKEIAEKLTQMGYDIDKKKVVLKDAIKMVGNYHVELKLYAGVTAKVIVAVKPL